MIWRTAAAVLATTLLTLTSAGAQQWPTKAVRIVVPFPPGGTTDTLARMLAKKYSDALAQPFIVENRTGASGMIGTEAVARGAADGYTVIFTSASLSVNTTLFAGKFKLDPVKDLAPVILAASTPLLLTSHPSVPVKSVRELVELSKRQKGGLNGGHNGSGTTAHIALEMFMQYTGAKLVQIPYKGGGPTTIALLSGEIDLCFSSLSTVKPHIESGRLKGLAVTTRKPSSVLPKLPTMDSVYPGFETDNWYSMFAPANTPKDIISRLHALAVDALKSQEIRDLMARDGGEIVASSPEELGAYFRNEIARYAKVIKAGKIKPE
jgi:tripartite-type tricarboxylate transporter receptor subunit TctC